MIEKFVFISYSSKEYAEATKVCIFLESKGIKCWMAPRNITPGASYASQIVSAINECSALVLLASQDSNDSGHVSNEISIAFDKKKTIIPFRLKEFDFSDEFIYFLGRKHWINAFENFDKGLDLLLHTLIPILDSKEIIQEEPTKDENIEDESSTSDKSHNEKEYITCSRCYTKNERHQHSVHNVDTRLNQTLTVKLKRNIVQNAEAKCLETSLFVQTAGIISIKIKKHVLRATQKCHQNFQYAQIVGIHLIQKQNFSSSINLIMILAHFK